MRILIALIGLAIGLPAMADIYQWTDDSGHVQMSDHPPAGVNAKVLKNNGLAAPSTQSTQEGNDVRKREDAALDAMKSKEEADKEAKKEAADTAQEQEATCSQLKKEAALYSSGARLVSVDSDGQRHYDTSDEVQQKQQTVAQELQDNHCN